jgi:multiple sugar transport system substrate-binding protein
MKKVTAVLVLVLLLVSSMMASGSGQTEEDKGPVTITWRQGEWWKESIPAIKDGFEKAHPNIKVINELVPWSAYLDKAVASTIGPNPPDVLAMSVLQMPVLAKKGVLTKLEPFVEKSTELTPDQFFDGGWKLGIYQGDLVSIPFRLEAIALYYNTNAFTEVGLDVDRPPRTHQEVLEYAKKLTIPGKRSGFAMSAGAKNPTHFMVDLSEVVWGMGADYLNETWTQAAVDTPKVKAAVKWWTDYYTTHKVVPEGSLSYDWNDIGRLFGQETVAMYYYGVAGVKGNSSIQETEVPTLKFKVSPIPPDKATFASSWGQTIPKNAKHKEEAWEFIEYFCSPEVLPEVAKRMPAVKAAPNHPAWSAPELNPFWENANYCRTFPGIGEWAEIQQIMVEEVQAVMLNKKSADEAMDQAAKRINGLLE